MILEICLALGSCLQLHKNSHRMNKLCGSWRSFPDRTPVDNVEYKHF